MLLLVVAIRPKCVVTTCLLLFNVKVSFLLNVMDFTHYKELHILSMHFGSPPFSLTTMVP